MLGGTRGCFRPVATPTRQTTLFLGPYTPPPTAFEIEAGMLVGSAGREQPSVVNSASLRVSRFPFRIDAFLHQFLAVLELPRIHPHRGEQDYSDAVFGLPALCAPGSEGTQIMRHRIHLCFSQM